MGKEAQEAQKVLANLRTLLPDLESVYRDIHSHPELSMQENRHSGNRCGPAPRCQLRGRDGCWQNGSGRCTPQRRRSNDPAASRHDALPVREATGLPYASSVIADQNGKSVPVMHACGHDMHVTWLIGAATLLAQNRDTWRGTLMPLFQPVKSSPGLNDAVVKSAAALNSNDPLWPGNSEN